MTLVPLRDRDHEPEVRVDHALLRRCIALLDALGEAHLVRRGQQLVPACGVHEELERVERARRRRRGLLLGGRGAHDDVALLERGAQGSELLVLELVLVRQRLDLLLLDEAALGGLLEQALGRREVVQVNRVGQFNPFLSRSGPSWATASRPRCAGTPRGAGWPS